MKSIKKIAKFLFYVYLVALVLYWIFKDMSAEMMIWVIVLLIQISSFLLILVGIYVVVKWITKSVTRTVKDEWDSDKK